jgi:hypothetical protein
VNRLKKNSFLLKENNLKKLINLPRNFLKSRLMNFKKIKIEYNSLKNKLNYRGAPPKMKPIKKLTLQENKLKISHRARSRGDLRI